MGSRSVAVWQVELVQSAWVDWWIEEASPAASALPEPKTYADETIETIHRRQVPAR